MRIKSNKKRKESVWKKTKARNRDTRANTASGDVGMMKSKMTSSTRKIFGQTLAKMSRRWRKTTLTVLLKCRERIEESKGWVSCSGLST